MAKDKKKKHRFEMVSSVEKISLHLHGMYWEGRELFVQALPR